jgi:hypothetical protein
MFDNEGNGWDETQLYVEVDGEIISVETGPVGNYSTFEFGVDEGDLVNLFYIPAGSAYGQSYVVEDNNNQEIISSGQSGAAGNSIGLLACPTTPTCGMIEIVMTHEYDGWGYNRLDVYKNDVLYLPIPFYFGTEQTTFIQADNGDVFDFEYIGGQGFDPEQEGYKIFGPDGVLVINQDITGQIPESAANIQFCEDNTGVSNLSSDQVISIFPNPTKELIEVDAPSSYYHSDVVLYDMGGVEIYRWKSWKGETLDMESSKPGVYFLEFQGEEVIKKRVVKI